MPEPEVPLDPTDDDDPSSFLEQALLALDGQLGPDGEEVLRSQMVADVGKRRLFVQLCLQTQELGEVLGSQDRGVIAEGIGDAGLSSAIGHRARRRAVAWGRPWLPWTITAAACI